jgi:hypothetical protein
MKVTKIVDQEVADKIDIQYIESQLTDIPDIGIIYVCTEEGGEEDEWIEEGIRYIVIQLPYPHVQNIEDARSLMLEKVKERLAIL